MNIQTQIHDCCEMHIFSKDTVFHMRMNMQKMKLNFKNKKVYTLWRNDLNLRIKSIELDEVFFADNDCTRTEFLLEESWWSLFNISYCNDTKLLTIEFKKLFTSEQCLPFIHFHFEVVPTKLEIPNIDI